MISVVSPIYNEEDALPELVRRVTEVLEKEGGAFEYILVDNGSTDRSAELIRSLRSRDPRIKYVSLSRNFGHQGGILAGITMAKGDAVISLDGDLQQPPELIPNLLEKWRDGADVVFTIKEDSAYTSGLRGLSTRFFYRTLSRISDLSLSYGQTDFRLLDRKVVDVLKSMPERQKFLRGLVEWVGYRQVGVPYQADVRRFGESKFSFRNYLSFALDGILSFSSVPLRIFLYFGLWVSALCFLYGGWALFCGVARFLGVPGYELPPGWATIAVAIVFLGGIQLMGIGILGAYVRRIFLQTKERPEFIVREKDLE